MNTNFIIEIRRMLRGLTAVCLLSFFAITPGIAQDADLIDYYRYSYQTKKIGDNIWMTENLRKAYFRNGDKIKQAQSAEVWQMADEKGEPAWCWYEDEKWENLYGKLYNSHAVKSHNGLCPEGWHIPSEKEWKQLEMYLGMTEEEVNKPNWRGDVAGKLKSERTAPEAHPRWEAPNKGATNESGFSALPAGYRTGNPNYEKQMKNSFRMLGKESVFWTSEGGGRALWAERIRIFRGDSGIAKGFGFSVCCIKD